MDNLHRDQAQSEINRRELEIAALHQTRGHSMATYLELRAQIAALTVQAEELREEAKAFAIEECKVRIAEFDLSAYDLGLIQHKQIPSVKVKLSEKTFAAKMPVKQTHPPKYIDPATGKTWSGRGHMPHWMTGNRDDYLIKTEPTKRVTQNNKHG